MLRGWVSKHHQSNDDTGASPPPPAQGQGDVKDQYITTGDNEDSNQHSTQEVSVEDAYPDEDKSMFREWKRSTDYEEVKDEILMSRREVIVTDMIDEDPLASPGNSSLNSGAFGGWSLSEGLKEKESIGIPYEDDEEGFIENNGRTSQTTTSPRESHFKRFGLSMVREDEREDDIPSSPNGAATLDDVDIEASPSTLHTANYNGSNHHNRRCRIGTLGSKGKITNRVILELQTNPKFKYRAIVALSMILALSCLIVVVVMSSSGKKELAYKEANKATELTDLLDEVMPIQTYAPTNAASTSPAVTPNVKSTVNTTTAPMLEPTGLPTLNPTMEPTILTTNTTEKSTTLIPSKSSTLSPSNSPMTMAPTRDCTDSPGEYMTWNGKPRTCEWLDNGHNGEKSARKDIDCIISELGDACQYTCRLYNGCMEYFLSSLSDYTNDNDVSVGDHCSDKSGMFISNGNIPRECSWLDEDEETAPAKKNYNCGTPDVPKTELGLMCPRSCAGYNDCKKAVDGSVERVSPNPLEDFNKQIDDGGEDTPTLYPTLLSPDEQTILSSDEPTAHCHDKEGEYLTHREFYRQCRWLNQDDIFSAKEKKDWNCGITEIGLNCLESCPCDVSEEKFDEELIDDTAPTFVPTLQPALISTTDDTTDDDLIEEMNGLDVEVCQDKDGEFQTHRGTYRQCRWLSQDDLDNAKEKKELNCGITEIGLSCLDSCPCDLLHVANEISTDDAAGADIPTDFPTLQPTSTSTDDAASVSIPTDLPTLQPTIISTVDVESEVDLTEELLDKVLKDGTADDSTSEMLGKELLEGGTPSDYPTVELALSPRAETPTSSTPTQMITTSPILELDCRDKKGKFRTPSGASQWCTWLSEGKGELKKELNCQEQNEAALFCQASCGAYNGCDAMHCTDMTGFYATYSGWLAECSFLVTTGQGSLKLEQNCGGVAGYPITEIGKRCQATCGDYNGCNTLDLRSEEDEVTTDDDDATADDLYEPDEVQSDDDAMTNDDDASVLNGVPTISPNLLDGWTYDVAASGTTYYREADEVIDDAIVNAEQLPVRGEAAAIFFGGLPTFFPTTLAPTTSTPLAYPKFKGLFDETGNMLTLSVFADASVSQMNSDGNFGEDKRLQIKNDAFDQGTAERQSLILFDLAFVAESFGSTVGKATLRIFLVDGSDSGSVTLKKMTSTNWTEDSVTWDNIPGGDGLDELIVSYVDTLDNDSWYDIDVTAAVLDALENGESYLGLRIVSTEIVDISFASKERWEEQPILIIDSRPAIDPTRTRQPKDYTVTDFPTPVPTTYSPTQITEKPTFSYQRRATPHKCLQRVPCCSLIA